MSKFAAKGSKYTDDQKAEAAIQYAILGNMKKVAKATGIPRTTIIGWKKADWWDDLVAKVRTEKTEEQIAMYSQIVDKAQRVTLEKLPSASPAQASIIAATATDKGRLLTNLPTSISGNLDTRALAEQCKELSRTMREKQVNVVEIQGETKKIE